MTSSFSSEDPGKKKKQDHSSTYEHPNGFVLFLRATQFPPETQGNYSVIRLLQTADSFQHSSGDQQSSSSRSYLARPAD